MKDYESMIIIDPSLSEAEAEEENKKFCSFIKGKDGEVLKTDTWGKRKLAYEVEDKKDGYYFVNFFKLEPSKSKEVFRYFKLNETIFRYNLLSE